MEFTYRRQWKFSMSSCNTQSDRIKMFVCLWGGTRPGNVSFLFSCCNYSVDCRTWFKAGTGLWKVVPKSQWSVQLGREKHVTTVTSCHAHGVLIINNVYVYVNVLFKKEISNLHKDISELFQDTCPRHLYYILVKIRRFKIRFMRRLTWKW